MSVSLKGYKNVCSILNWLGKGKSPLTYFVEQKLKVVKKEKIKNKNKILLACNRTENHQNGSNSTGVVVNRFW